MGGKSSVPASPTPSHKPVMVAAIDFGTTYSGYAFAFNNDPENIILNKDWGAELGTSSLKTPTSVLINQKGEFESFGYKAENDYAHHCSDMKTEQYELFRHFKMTLYNETIKRSSMVKSVRGKEFSIMSLTVYSLRFLKQQLLEAVSKLNRIIHNNMLRKPDDKSIKWVLTVPAIWHEDAKQFMREAAVQAGLIEEQYSDQLILALEPEAASVFCRSLDVNDFNKELPIDGEVKFANGTKYLIADIGGGTLDITAHEIRNENELVELMSANGGDLGGMKVNDRFENLLHDTLGADFVQHFKEAHPNQWLQLMVQYEFKKRDVTAIDNEGIDVGINLFIKQEFKSFTGKELEDVINSDIPGLSYCRGIIDIQPTNVQKLFDPVIDNIICCIDEALKNEALKDLKYLIIVGGFGDSAYLFHKIKKAFSNMCSIISPSAASSVILKGAVLFGQNPSTIISRVCRKTYGVGIDEEFIDGKHRESKQYNRRDGRLMAKDVFMPYVKNGEQVPVDACKTYKFHSAKKDISIFIYCTDRTDVIHTDEVGVIQLEELSLKTPLLKWLFSFGSERTIECKIYFGKTEITVDVEDKKTHQIVKTSIDFLKE